MADHQDSMAQLLATLGISREDLVRRSQEMRQFLGADSSFLAANPPPPLSAPRVAQASAGTSNNSWLSSTPLGPAKVPDASTLAPETPKTDTVSVSSNAVQRKPRQIIPPVKTPPSPTPAARLRSPSQSRQDASQPTTLPRSSQELQELQALVQKAFGDDQKAVFSPSPTKSIVRGRQAGASSSSPLPSSSPAAQRSPSSSPVRPVNIVSSPVSSPVKESDEYGRPYTLPPGPYSDKKPDWSYAAMIGQAVLSSPQHRLTLQEIYEWITTVYPFFKRGETTWMNSIRHVLSTTVTFRKVPRDRALGRTLWAIYDDDLACFEGGGFKKHLCKDYVESLQKKGLQPTVSGNGKTRSRKREDDEHDSGAPVPPSKKPKLETTDSVPAPSASVPLALPPMRAHAARKYGQQTRTIFPSGGTNQQSYYDVCMQEAAAKAGSGSQSQAGPSHLPEPSAAAIATLLPPVMATPSPLKQSRSQPLSGSDDDEPLDEERYQITSTPQSAMRSQMRDDDVLPSSSLPSSPRSSLPDLTPDGRSSSPPTSSYPATSEADIDEYLCVPSDEEDEASMEYQDPASFHDIIPGSLLNKGGLDNTDDARYPFGGRSAKMWQFSNLMDSPSSNRSKTKRRLSTPPPDDSLPPTLPCTPPKFSLTGASSSKRSLLSPQSTPLSHKGFHMSPSTSLMHYKSHLDPPPPSRTFRDDDDDDNEREHLQPNTSHLRTPSRTRPDRVRSSLLHVGGGLGMTPRTPGGLFRTPGVAESPFPAPSIDPYDASAILAQEVKAARSRRLEDSPFGVLKRSNLLYQSPGLGDGNWY
ncbi:hypothetical protein DL96DRAFT_1677020 [Flagelloscypha sp. PMI_526]|nr:hypothetical protein DL96DRAFT_1677020 [Flagelloscypha sp. PMI_526]